MSLSSALATAMSGLSANQAAIAIASSNVANAQTAGYVTQTINQTEVASGGIGTGVRVTGINRQLDQYVQAQMRTENAGGGYADQLSNILGQLQSVYGTPGGAGSLETSFTNFTTALQGLSSDPSDPSAQVSAVNSAQTLAQTLNTTTQGIQSLRTNVEQDLGTSVNQANADLKQIASLNDQLQGMQSTDPAAATLMDQRDSAIDDLSSLMDIKVVTDTTNQANIYTTSGIQLAGHDASTLSFNGQGNLGATSLWNADPTKSGVGTLSVKLPNGSSIDMIANNSISSGRIAADLTLRDKTLVQAQSQVDQMAATLSTSLSNQTTSGTTVAGPPAGFSLDLSNVLPGNSINLTYTDASNVQHQVQIVRVDDPSALPLSNPAGSGVQTIGVNFSGGMASVASQLTAALGSSGLQFSMSGSTLSVLGNSSGSVTVGAASTTVTASALANGSTQLPLFTDGTSLYTGAITASGSQQVGLAGRIAVNTAVLSNPSLLATYSTSPATAAGDTTRTDFLYSQLTSGTYTYSPQTGLGSTSSPFSGTMTNFMQQFLSQQSNAASAATQLQQGQDVVVSTLQQKYNSTAGVNIDTEMSNLIALQNTYAANAHVMSVVQGMMSTLMQIQL